MGAEREELKKVALTPEAPKKPTPKKDEVIVVFKFPDGKQVPATFRESQGGFDIFAKAFQIQEEQPTAMKLSGGAIEGTKTLDEALTFSTDVAGLGMKAGNAYEIAVEL